VTAEFAIVLPAVLLVLTLAIGAILLATHRIVLTSAAADIARLEARGDTAGASARIAGLEGPTSITRTVRGRLHCVRLSSNPLRGLLARVSVSAQACAARSEPSAGAVIPGARS